MFTMKSFMISMFGSGSTSIWVADELASWVRQASTGAPFTNMPQEPHTALRQEKRKARLSSSVSWIFSSASRTVVP